ncbi:hypothetical protein [Listeria fleischmannii]|uniref:hypothetical protein n=1 Tax=Listeria fleischmannii TaxID=1069827 RepID=UPI0021006719|nr:hypothetical protein [Listeria fleischmannii]
MAIALSGENLEEAISFSKMFKMLGMSENIHLMWFLIFGIVEWLKENVRQNFCLKNTRKGRIFIWQNKKLALSEWE